MCHQCLIVRREMQKFQQPNRHVSKSRYVEIYMIGIDIEYNQIGTKCRKSHTPRKGTLSVRNFRYGYDKVEESQLFERTYERLQHFDMIKTWSKSHNSYERPLEGKNRKGTTLPKSFKKHYKNLWIQRQTFFRL